MKYNMQRKKILLWHGSKIFVVQVQCNTGAPRSKLFYFTATSFFYHFFFISFTIKSCSCLFITGPVVTSTAVLNFFFFCLKDITKHNQQLYHITGKELCGGKCDKVTPAATPMLPVLWKSSDAALVIC